MQVVGFEMLAIGARFEWGGLVKPQQPHSVGSEVKVGIINGRERRQFTITLHTSSATA